MRWLLVFLIACSSHEPVKKDPPPTPTPTPTPTPAPAPTPPPTAKPEMCEVANAGPGFLFCKGKTYEGVIPSGGGYDWTPSPMEVAEVELALGPAITAHPELGTAHPAPDFKRMWTGVNVKGHKVMRVFLACQVDQDWPAKGLPVVKDGGPCYGAADYDMTTKTITSLYANGSG